MSAGFPGSLHDSRILRNTWVFREATSQQILTLPKFQLTGTHEIRPYLVGDAAYPQADWLIKPFSFEKHLEDRKTFFNLALSQARVSVERAFGVLKGRWRLLMGKLNLQPSFASDVVIACTVLHNICQDFHEPIEDNLDRCNDDQAEAHEASHSSDTIRQLLVQYINDHAQNASFD